MFDFSNYSTKSKYYDNLNRLVVGKIERCNSWCCDQIICRIKVKDANMHPKQWV